MGIQIGKWSFDPEANTLSDGKNVVSLENRTARVLAYFVENPGRVISKDELLDAVWGRQAISDHSVSIVISDLRKAFGDSAKNSTIIKTVAKKGYIFLPPNPKADMFSEPKATHFGFRISAVLIRVAGGFLFWSKSQQPDTLIFYDLEPQAATADELRVAEYLSESLLVELSKVPDIKVVRIRNPETNNQSVFALIEILFTPDPIFLRGSVTQANDQFRMILRLEEGNNREVIWGFEEELVEDYHYLSGRRALQSLGAELNWTTPEVTRVESERAERLFWRGVYLWESRNGHNTQASHEALLEALEIEPDFPRAHAQLATIFAHKTGPYLGYETPFLFEQAEHHLAEAERLGADLPEISITKALVAFYRDYDFEGALAFLDEGVERWPNNPTLWQTRGMVTSAMGQHDESIFSAQKALALDPLSHSINWDRVWFLYLAERYDEALLAAQETPEITGDVHHYYVGLIHEALGNRSAAFQSWVAMLAEIGFILPETLPGPGQDITPDHYKALLDAVEADGRPFYPSAVKVFWAYLSGDQDRTFHLLETIPVEQENWVYYWLPEIPLFAELRDETRFQTLMASRE